jgi:RNA recognition motif-containing protein
MRIYVGNLPWSVDDDELRKLFEQYGHVANATVIYEQESNRSRGFGFVEMDDAGEAQAAIDDLNDSDLHGRALTVNKAKPREDRRRSRG